MTHLPHGRRLLGAFGVLVLAAALTTVPTAGATPALPDLTSLPGTVTYTPGAATANVVVTLKNAGAGNASASKETATLTYGGTAHQVYTWTMPRLLAGRTRVFRFPIAVPTSLGVGEHAVRVCVDTAKQVTESNEANNCALVADLVVYKTGTPFDIGPAATRFVAYVPSTYKPGTKARLLIWLHACGGRSADDIWTVADWWGYNYIAVAPLAREGKCWNVNDDPALVLATIAEAEKDFTIAPRRVFIGGYSSGGDLAYRTAFYNSTRFAEVLAMNTSPFRDTGSTAAESLAAATTKFHVFH
ncbi:MAG TPA: CARDB domain-containing protein, partial [Marmoricola sp.]